MRRKGYFFVVGCFLFILFISSISLAAAGGEMGTIVQAKDGADGNDLITVLNPLGQPPEIEIFPLAPRFETLEGKMIYIVDVKYPGSKSFAQQLTKALEEKYPGTNWIFREKIGTYFDDDPDLWAEIKKNGAGMIIFIGH